MSTLSLLTLLWARAEKQSVSREQAEALISGLKRQHGDVTLHAGLAILHVPDGFQFLDGPDALTVLVKLWGNPPASAAPLGMLMPDGVSPLSEKSWAVVMTYEPDGYVSDKDAEEINYSELLTQMQKSVASGNEERQKAGYEPVDLIGWAKTPRYDSQSHKLYWRRS